MQYTLYSIQYTVHSAQYLLAPLHEVYQRLPPRPVPLQRVRVHLTCRVYSSIVYVSIKDIHIYTYTHIHTHIHCSPACRSACIYVTCITTIDKIIKNNYTNDAYTYDTYLLAEAPVAVHDDRYMLGHHWGHWGTIQQSHLLLHLFLHTIHLMHLVWLVWERIRFACM
jgi:hypothetical protein